MGLGRCFLIARRVACRLFSCGWARLEVRYARPVCGAGLIRMLRQSGS